VILQKSYANLVGRKGVASMAGCLPAIKSVTSSAVAVAAVRPIMPSPVAINRLVFFGAALQIWGRTKLTSLLWQRDRFSNWEIGALLGISYSNVSRWVIEIRENPEKDREVRDRYRALSELIKM
jgi:DNA-binding transcriptional regulator YdaS (Cro superfamily)